MHVLTLAVFPDSGVGFECQLGGLGAERFKQMEQARIGRAWGGAKSKNIGSAARIMLP